ncbi:MAG: TIGR02452 family protein [Ktedonobacterales bacterium]|nr:TIGR02452 family protein [Ktedonobacterales bacterium]
MDPKAIAVSTIAALERGHYTAPDGTVVDIAASRDACVSATRAYLPEELAAVREHVSQTSSEPLATTFAVVNETTLNGCARLVTDQRYQRVGALNFASAKNPGGGFLNGARAQEESLARSSGLYPSLRACPEHYAAHRALETCLYSDRMIYSPACPIFRDDQGGWLPQPYMVDFITSPAPNAGVVMRNEPEHRTLITPTLAERARKVLALALHHGCDALVLGAWGCGVFQNDPATVAGIFHDLLQPSGIYAGRFRHVLFAVYDTAKDKATYSAFALQFAAMI